MSGQFGTSLNNPPQPFEYNSVIPNYQAPIACPVNNQFTATATGLLFIESTDNNGNGTVTINGSQLIYGGGEGFASDYYSITFLVKKGDIINTTLAGRVIIFPFEGTL